MKRLLGVFGFLLVAGVGPKPAYSAPITWQIPGMSGQTLTLPFTGQTEAIAGGDVVLHEFITGVDTPVLTFGPSVFQLSGNVGACTQAFTGSPAIQPYVSVSHNLKQYISALANVQSLDIQGFGRYDTTVGRLGAGFAIGYIF